MFELRGSKVGVTEDSIDIDEHARKKENDGEKSRKTHHRIKVHFGNAKFETFEISFRPIYMRCLVPERNETKRNFRNEVWQDFLLDNSLVFSFVGNMQYHVGSLLELTLSSTRAILKGKRALSNPVFQFSYL